MTNKEIIKMLEEIDESIYQAGNGYWHVEKLDDWMKIMIKKEEVKRGK